ncbi:MAG: M23 family metallopeptidase [Anaerolineales bacterium]
MPRIAIILLGIVCLLGGIAPSDPPRAAAQFPPGERPLILPINLPPGPGNWLIGQHYGNTTGAYNFGARWYSAGQGLHFGLDLFAPCGTPLVSMADGVVHAVDAGAFGSAPHNLIMRHDELNLSILYGHLLETPPLNPGDFVPQGAYIGLVGDPDGVCTSRPHLHLEIRSLDFRTTFNPIDYIEAPWHMLSSIGMFSNPQFQQDMDNPRRWMTLRDQPTVQFGGARLNDYAVTWPYPLDVRPPDNAPLPRALGPLPAGGAWTTRALTTGGCCAYPWWGPEDSERFYVIDGPNGQRANVFEYRVDGAAAPQPIEPAPPMLLSPDGAYQVTRVNGLVTIRDLGDLSEWAVETQGALPAISTDNSRLLWEVWRGGYLPGESYQTVETWMSNLDGSQARMIWQQPGGWAVWLDAARALIVTPILDRTETRLTIYDTRTDEHFVLGIWNWIRDISVAPGGERLMFYLVNQTDPARNGVYTIRTEQGAVAEALPFFGGWRWRDAESVYYVPLDISSGNAATLAYYHIPSAENRYLTDAAVTPLYIANADWHVSPDGRRIIYRNAQDDNLWLAELTP